MTNTSHSDLPTVRRLILRSLRVGKWILSTIWIVILLGIVDSTISTWLTSKHLDLTGTPLGWIFQNLLLVIPSGFCLLLLTILAWVVYSFLERDTSWLYTAEERQRSKLRRLFASYIEHEIEWISIQEDWKDYQFTELEAEVETQGRQREPKILALFRHSHDRFRREKSLSEALRKSSGKIILVEGEPGSGKSVALRHVALEMIQQAKKVQSAESVLPIYVNMKLLERKHGEKINRDLIEAFIVKALKRSNDRAVQLFLKNEFQDGMQNRAFFFLFDSFDEIPEVLNSTEADDKVNDYAKAIDDFLHGTNQCRGVIASRFYHGPTRLGWVRFRIMPLSEHRQIELISKTDLTSQARWVVGQLGNANQTIRSMASNPFFLALLCKYLEGRLSFPENVHVVYETYIDQRFTDDKKELQRDFGLDTAQVREGAEAIAFCMTASPSLGLNPTRSDLQDTITTLGLDISCPLEKLLDALEYMRLARPDTAANTNISKSFTFSHRRFQEYFATCFVLRESKRVPPKQLLTQGAWRETAVVLCQTQPVEKLAPLLRQVERLLNGFCTNLPDLIINPVEYIADKGRNTTTNKLLPPNRFSWPSGLFHLLSLLQDGFTSRLTVLPNLVRAYADKLLLSATEQGTREDKKWSLEVAGITSKSVFEFLLKEAFSSDSLWLKEVAYRQVARLSQTPPEISKGIRETLINLAASKRLPQERHATTIYLKRLSQPEQFLSIMKLLLLLLRIDILLLICGTFIMLYGSSLLSPATIFYQYSKNLPEEVLYLLGSLFCFVYLSHKGLPDLMRLFLWSKSKDFEPKSLPIMIFRSIVQILPLELAIISATKQINISIIFLLIVAVYASLFTPLAVAATRTGNYTNQYWWPFIPVWPVLYLLRYPKLVLMSLWRKRSSIIRGLGIVLVLAGVGLGGYRLIVWANTPNAKDYPLLNIGIGVLLLIVEIGIVIGFIRMIVNSIIDAYKHIHDRLKWYRWRRNHREPITHQELYEALEGYRDPKAICTEIIQFVREQHLLFATHESVESLKKVTLDIETRLYKDKQQQNRKHKKLLHRVTFSSKDMSTSKSIKFRSLKGFDLLVSFASNATLDELCVLLNDIQVP